MGCRFDLFKNIFSGVPVLWILTAEKWSGLEKGDIQGRYGHGMNSVLWASRRTRDRVAQLWSANTWVELWWRSLLVQTREVRCTQCGGQLSATNRGGGCDSCD